MKLEIEGMSCQHCVHAVKNALESLDGVEVEDVSIGSAEVTVDSTKIESSAIERAIAAEGYRVTDIA